MNRLEKKIKVIEVKRDGLHSQIQQINKANEQKRRFTLGLGDDEEEFSNLREKQVSRLMSTLSNQQDGVRYVER